MLRRRAVVAAIAFATLFISSVEVTYAQPAINGEVELLVSAPTSEELKAAVSTPNEPTWPTLIEMSDRSSVLAWDMMMVSVMIQKVEQARTAKGARAIGKEMAQEKKVVLLAKGSVLSSNLPDYTELLNESLASQAEEQEKEED